MHDIIESGLTHTEAEAAAERHGTNALTRKAKAGFGRRYLASFGDPIIRILMLALGVNLLLLFRDANWYESAGIAVAVLLATLISTLSEYGSESAFEKLQEEAASIKCRVRRGYKLLHIPITDIVVGDIVLVQAGERIPADGVLVAGEIAVDQSALNGEAHEARKWPTSDIAAFAPETDDFLSREGLFRGSVVCSGEGIMHVTQVGDATFYGQLATDIQDENLESPLKTRLTRLARLISRFGYGAAAVVFLANLFNAIVLENQFNPVYIAAYLGNHGQLLRDFMTALTLGITVIVMAVPEGLPMMITVVLSANMRRMLKDNVLVRKLVGIETSGSLNILFTDKTGTLTRGQLRVSAFVTGAGAAIPGSKLHSHEALYHRVALHCFYNNAAQIVTKKCKPVAVGGNSTDRALLEYVMPDAHRLPLCARGFHKPFDSRDKFMATEITGEARGVLLKGAPESLLPACRFAYTQESERVPFPHPVALKYALQKHAQEGIRLLALCEAATPADAQYRRNLTLVGILAIRDELREEAADAIREVRQAGVQVVMVTGDNRETAVSIAAQLNLIAGEYKSGDAPMPMSASEELYSPVLTSAQLNQLTDQELKARLPHLRVVARALPTDKGRLVRLAQEMGLVAGMTGDGVNDAPALKKADVGFSMGDGTEIAKEAGDIVILDNNFASIVRAVLYGRTIFKSIRKFLIFQLTINLCAVGISVIGPFIGVDVPVTVIQMLWINMIMDTLAGLAYAGEPPLPEYMSEPPKRRNIPIINRYMFSQILSTGAFITFLGILFLTFPFFREFYRNDPAYLQTAFFGLFIFAGVFNALNARTTRLNLFSYIGRNKLFIAIMLAVAAMQILLIYHGGTVFRTTGLSLRELALVIGLSTTVIGCDLGRKLIMRMYNRKGYI
ncbi:MAG: cation-translocating P-type ATPase [Defluviitaleaceae bacterium]|nr:cation-translocating P-type ATPase [Defluviitaleaceae bacterium]MCL2239485.1 cation-translocating P-type ATPase [Defluviitaleaceae bacterium]